MQTVPAKDSPTPCSKKIKTEEEPDDDEVEMMDEETKNWTVPAEHEDELELMKQNYRAIPLRVYRDGKFIEPVNVTDQLENTLAEVTFSINHTHIKKRKDFPDSFQAEICQIVILKKRNVMTADPRAGPSQVRKRRRDDRKPNETQKGEETSRPDPSKAGPSGA